MEELKVTGEDESVKDVSEQATQGEKVVRGRILDFGCCKIECLCCRYIMRKIRSSENVADTEEQIPKEVIEKAEKFAQQWFHANEDIGLAFVPDAVEIMIYKQMMVLLATLMLQLGMHPTKVQESFDAENIKTIDKDSLERISNFFSRWMEENTDRKISYFPDNCEQWLHSKVASLVISVLNSTKFFFDGFDILVKHELPSEYDIRDSSEVDLAHVFYEHPDPLSTTLTDQIIDDLINFYAHMLISSGTLNIFGLDVFTEVEQNEEDSSVAVENVPAEQEEMNTELLV